MAPHLAPIVVDNASSDGTGECVLARGAVELIANSENRGFAAAANQGFHAAVDRHAAELVLLFNPDAVLLTGIDELIEAGRQYGIAAGKLVDAGGAAQRGFTLARFPTPAALILELFGVNRLWPSNPVNRHYRYFDRDLGQPGPVDQPAGAFLMIRRDVWERLGGFDERFHPVWFEDVDFCRRAADSGIRIEYVPAVIASHEGGHSAGQIPRGCRALYWCVSLLRYAAKHFRAIGYRGVCAAVVLSSFPRMVAEMIVERSLTPVAAYSRIVRLAGLCLLSRQGLRHNVDRIS